MKVCMMRRPSWGPTYSHLRRINSSIELSAAVPALLIMPALLRDRHTLESIESIPNQSGGISGTQLHLKKHPWRDIDADRAPKRGYQCASRGNKCKRQVW
jgi:hypothetical protein